MPDAEGRVWFTSKFGVVGMIHVDKARALPARLHDLNRRTSRSATRFTTTTGTSFPKVPEEFIARLKQSEKEGTLVEKMAEFRREGPGNLRHRSRRALRTDRRIRSRSGLTVSTSSRTSGSTSSGSTTRPGASSSTRTGWPTYAKDQLFYENDRKIKPGHLNNGSGTTPTLIDDRFVAIVDNAPGHVNLNVFRQKDGTLVSKLPLFESGAGAVENSVVAYRDHLIVGNTYGYVDPFIENPTAGGIARFDYDPTKDEYIARKDWPAVGHFDGKTATPKLSTADGLFYVYHRDMLEEGHHDWQLTALDFHTGWRVFSIKGYFAGTTSTTMSGIVKKKTLGKKDYGKKVFNNIWGTFSFGPRNSIFIGTYRGYVRFSSARISRPRTSRTTGRSQNVRRGVPRRQRARFSAYIRLK